MASNLIRRVFWGGMMVLLLGVLPVSASDYNQTVYLSQDDALATVFFGIGTRDGDHC